MTKRRIYCNIFERETGKMVVSDELPNEDFYYQYQLKKDKYDIYCSTCGGKGNIVFRHRASNNNIIDYYLMGNHTDDCLVASNGSLKKIQTGEIGFDFFDGKFIEKNESYESEKKHQQDGQKSDVSSSTVYSNGTQYLKKMSKAYFDMLFSLNLNVQVNIKEGKNNVQRKVGDLIINGKEDNYGKNLNGSRVIVGCQVPSKLEDSEENLTIYLALPRKKGDRMVIVLFHFPNVNEWKKFKEKKEQYIKINAENADSYNQWNEARKNYKNNMASEKTSVHYEKKAKDVPVIACELKKSYELSVANKTDVYETNIFDKNYIWISEAELS